MSRKSYFIIVLILVCVAALVLVILSPHIRSGFIISTIEDSDTFSKRGVNYNIEVNPENECTITCSGSELTQTITSNLKERRNSITTITLNGSFTSIEEKAFYGFSGLEEITIPEGVEEIGAEAFEWCDSLKSITIPSTIKTIGASAFCNCENLGSIVIPEGVETIQKETFEACRGLTSISLPSSLKHIDDQAFFGCERLQNIQIPTALETLGRNVFLSCSSLACNLYNNAYYLGNTMNPHLILLGLADNNAKECIVHEDTKIISSFAFSGQDSDEIGYRGVQDIVDLIGSAFSGTTKDEETILAHDCTNKLQRVVLPEGLKSIGYAAFVNCKQLVSVNIPSTVSIIDVNTFAYCSSLMSILIPSSIGDVKSDAFAHCPKLCEVVNLSNNTISIGKEMNGFNGDEDYPLVIYKTATFTSKITQDANGFVLYNDGEDISIINYVGDSKEPTIPSNATKIASIAFESCDIERIVIPGNIKTIREGAFAMSPSLQSVVISDGVENIEGSIFYNCTALKEVDFQNNQTRIPEKMFAECVGLTAFTIPSSIETIDKNAFEGCQNLESVELIGNIKYVKSEAFKGCIKLNFIRISKTIKNINEDAFLNCKKLNKIYFNGTAAEFKLVYYSPSADKTVRVWADDADNFDANIKIGA